MHYFGLAELARVAEPPLAGRGRVGIEECDAVDPTRVAEP